MSIALAILGLGLLVLVHEAGHFLASLAVGLRPRRFYVGFPPPLVRVRRTGIEYGIGVVPLGGFVTIPGMLKPIGHDAERRLSAAVAEAPALAAPVERLERALDAEDDGGAREALDELESTLRRVALSERAAARAQKGLTELRDALGPEAYWKAPTWKRLVAIAAGPAANVLLAVCLFAILFMTVAGTPTSTVAAVAPEVAPGVPSPAERIGLRPGDRIVAIDGSPVAADEIASTIGASEGRPLTLTVVRDGREIVLGPIAATEVDGRYRIGFSLRGEGLGLFESLREGVRLAGIVSWEIVKAIGSLATGSGRENVASPIGITQASSDAIEQGADSYLWVLALISLSLALLNLLPLLPLDGGHILFTLVEGARGRFVRREIYERVSVIGIAVVVLLFLIGITNDIGRLS
ncbi:MAG: M50 family metallopeptidase [Thermoleophilia bacterium]|nr:site-2 protease family protein [Gaiellaceae bacterium]MDW8337892.1 M50 family metallopeptidase [Thermoleophilia bacterium]